jgi:hypothetical protein
LKRNGKQSKPPLGGWGYSIKKEGFLCVLKNVELYLLMFIFLSFGVLLLIFAAKLQELYGTKRRY